MKSLSSLYAEFCPPPIVVTTKNRNFVRKFVRRHGVPSRIAEKLKLHELEVAYNNPNALKKLIDTSSKSGRKTKHAESTIISQVGSVTITLEVRNTDNEALIASLAKLLGVQTQT
jgi:hypothetical protein